MKLKLKKALTSWQVFHAAKEVLGLDFLYHLWGFRNARLIQAWCADPRECESAAPNPIDKLQRMLEELHTLGRRDLALAAVKCIARPLGFEVRDPKDIQTDKEDPNLEFLDVVNAIGQVSKELQSALEDQVLTEEEKARVLEAVDEVIKQLMQLKDAVRKA